MTKKILKGIGIFLLILIIALISIPYLFKDKIKEMVVNAINENVDATVAFEDIDLSLLKSFPRANVTIKELSIINKAPFEGDTLFYSGELNLKMAVTELFKGEKEPMNIESFYSKNGIVNILFNKDGIGNFDIAIKKDEEDDKDNSENKPFSLSIQNYEIQNWKFTYFDEKSNMKMIIDELNHHGKGDMAATQLDLDTETSAKLTFVMDQTSYMKNVALHLDAVLGIDFEKGKYTFKENKAKINQLELEFDGFLELLEAGQNFDLTFKTPTSSFKNFLGVIPEAYAGNLNGVKTSGDFTVSGFAKGMLTETTIPKFRLELASNNASFQYPDLPKSVQNIVIDTKIINETGLMKDIYVDIDKLSFKIDQDVFNAHAKIKNITENPLIDAKLNGIINLANVSKAYPIQLDTPLSGILKADLTTSFDMKAIENNQYERIQNSGNISVTGFKYVDEDKKTFNINQATAQFSPSKIDLKTLDITTGKTDIQINGVLDNFYGYLFKKQDLKGTFNMSSDQLLVSDFMSKTETTVNEKTTTTEAIKIPKNLDITLNANAKSVMYDNLNLKDVSGKLIIKDEAIALQNLKTSIFNGLITATGTVSTKETKPKFDMNLGLNAVDITQTFTQLEMLKKIAPIAGVISGKINSTIKLSGNLDAKEMTPDLNTLSGDLLGEFLSPALNSENSTMLTKLDNNLSFIDLKKINLKDVTTHLTFKDGKVNVNPIDIKYQDMKFKVGGQHGFDQSMNYNLTFDVPAKYLGNEVANLLSKLSPAETNKLQNIPITANLTGNFSNPVISTDMKSAVTNLTNQLVQQQKDKAVEKGKDLLGNLLGGNSNKETENSTKKDSATTTKKEETKDKVTNAIKGIFGK